MRRPRPKNLLFAQTLRSASTSVTRCGYYSYTSGSYSEHWPVEERISSIGTLIAVDPISEASLRIRAKIKDLNVNIAQNLCEYPQAAKMFGSLVGDVVSTYRNIRGGLPSLFSAGFDRLLKKGDPAAKRAANRWLQYQYGIAPMVGDIHSLIDHMLRSVRAGRLLSATVSGRNALNRQDYNDSVYWRKQTGFQFWTAKLYYTVRADSLPRELAQLGISNPLLLAWELIPFSFVVDWIIDVGGFMSSIDAFNGVAINGGYITRKDDFTVVARYRGGESVTTNKVYIRQPFSAPMPGIPRYKPSSSAMVFANGAALITQICYSARK